MRSRFVFLTTGLTAALTVVSCSAPAAPTVDSAPPASVSDQACASQPEAPTEPMAAAPTQAAEAQPVPTSRGPKLEATDPAAVSLAAGQIQLLEFFRFT